MEKVINYIILDNKLKLNLKAQEFKPKTSYNPSQGYNPMQMGSNIYNTGGGYTANPNMMGYDPNQMYNQFPNNNQYQQFQMNNQFGMNPQQMNQYMQQMSNININEKQQSKPEGSGGVVGMVGMGKNKKKGKPQSQSTTTTTTTSTGNIIKEKKIKDPNDQFGGIVVKKKGGDKKEEAKKEEIKEIVKEKPQENLNVKRENSDKDNAIDIELVSDSKEGKMIEVDESKEPCSIVFIGHVDAGKSTIAGNILLLTGQVDERIIDKYQREAKNHNRESWYMAYVMDINDDERERGKTVEVGKAFFPTKNKRFTVLDAPGHSGYLPNMLQGACQADFGGLVISAKIGEFEAGFDRNGSTREHALLAKSLGVNKLVIIVNKMDDETVKWSEERYKQIKSELSEYLKKIGYNMESDVHFIPISGLYGDNVKERVSKTKCPWYDGATLLNLLDGLETPNRNPNGPVRLAILDRYKEGGMQILGKIESGTIKYGNSYTIMPGKIQVDVQWIFNSEEQGVPYARPGENVRVISLMFSSKSAVVIAIMM